MAEVTAKSDEPSSSSWNRWMRVKRTYGLEPPDSIWQAKGTVGIDEQTYQGTGYLLDEMAKLKKTVGEIREDQREF